MSQNLNQTQLFFWSLPREAQATVGCFLLLLADLAVLTVQKKMASKGESSQWEQSWPKLATCGRWPKVAKRSKNTPKIAKSAQRAATFGYFWLLPAVSGCFWLCAFSVIIHCGEVKSLFLISGVILEYL